MDKCILAISREFGSGGRLIGEKLAEALGVAFFDKALIQMSAEKSGLSYTFIEQNEEHMSNSFLFSVPAAVSYASFKTTAFFDTPINDQTYLAQTEVIRELASKGSCVIVGRCADYILRDDPSLVKLFITGTQEDRIRRSVEHYHMPADEAEERIKKIDKSRANYYKYYTGQAWGNMHNYDLIINTSFTGIQGAVDVILTALKEKDIPTKSN